MLTVLICHAAHKHVQSGMYLMRVPTHMPLHRLSDYRLLGWLGQGLLTKWHDEQPQACSRRLSCTPARPWCRTDPSVLASTPMRAATGKYASCCSLLHLTQPLADQRIVHRKRTLPDAHHIQQPRKADADKGCALQASLQAGLQSQMSLARRCCSFLLLGDLLLHSFGIPASHAVELFWFRLFRLCQ